MNEFTSVLQKMRFMTLQIKEELEKGNYHSDRILIFRSEFNALCWQFLQLLLSKNGATQNKRTIHQLQEDFLEMHQVVVRHQQQWLHTRALADSEGYLASSRLITVRILRFIDNAVRKIDAAAHGELPPVSPSIEGA